MPPESKKAGIIVKVKFFTTLREVVGKKEEQVELLSRSVTVEALLQQLSTIYGKEFKDYVYDELGNVRGHLQFLVNGKSASALKGLKTKLAEGDQVAILPPVGGG